MQRREIIRIAIEHLMESRRRSSFFIVNRRRELTAGFSNEELELFLSVIRENVKESEKELKYMLKKTY